MKILCLHGAGANNQIFELQTATLRSLLDDFTFEFVEGTVPHLEGSWSRHYQSSPNDDDESLYTYCKPLELDSLLETELSLLELILEEDPPFDGVLAYSSGAALAAQVFLRHEGQRHKLPRQLDSTPLFKFAIFCNAVTPGRIFTMEEEGQWSRVLSDRFLKDEAMQFFDIIAGFRLRASPQLANEISKRRMKEREYLDKSFTTRTLLDGTPFLTNGRNCVAWFERDKVKIEIPTLHVFDLSEPELLGRGMLELCEGGRAREYHHSHGHEFPRGYTEMKEIARLIRELADDSVA